MILSAGILSRYKKGKRAYGGVEKAGLTAPSPPPGNVAARTQPPRRGGLNLRSLAVPGPLCGVSWETRLIDLQPPKFNLAAVRTGSCPAVQAPPSSPGRARDAPCPRGGAGRPPLRSTTCRRESSAQGCTGRVRGRPDSRHDLCLRGARRSRPFP